MATISYAPATAEPETLRPPRRRRRPSRSTVIGWLFLLPLFTTNVLVVLGPSLQSIYYSFTDWSGIGASHWTGLENYRRLLDDSDFRSAFWHNILWTAISLVLPTLLGLTGAYLLSRVKRYQVLFRLAYFVPYVVASVVSAAVWKSLLSPDHGLGELVGSNFLGSKALALPTVAVVNTWAFWGFLVVVYLSAMQSVRVELYEASALDGAGPFRQFISITLPNIRPTLVFMTVQTLIWSFLAFDFVYILTQGGPAGATDVLSTFMYRAAFGNLEAGYASAVGVVMALFSVMVITSYQVLRRLRSWEA